MTCMREEGLLHGVNRNGNAAMGSLLGVSLMDKKRNSHQKDAGVACIRPTDKI